MITHIKTKGFKGFDINEDIHPKTLYFGKNMSGKTTRSAAIALTILGFVPFAARATKNNAEILKDFGQGNTLTTSVVLDGVEFERHFFKSEKGSVSQRLRVNKKKYSAKEFSIELFKAGNPNIVSVTDFISSSDQVKINTLFSLFPPKANLKNLDDKIDKAKKKVNDLQAKEKTAKGVIQRLTKNKAEIELPAGSLAEIKAEIETTTKQVKNAQAELKAAEIESAEHEATKKANAKKQKEFDKIMEKGGPGVKPTKEQTNDHIDNYMASNPALQRIHDFTSGKPGPFDNLNDNNPIESIQRILETLNQSGCEICAAAIVAKQELKKFKKEVAA